MVVANPKHRERTEEVWKLPAGTLNPKVGSHITKMMRDLEDGSLKWLWVQVTNPVPIDRQRQSLDPKRRAKRTVSSSSPTSTRRLSCKVADLILPAAMIFEKWGAYGNSERRTQVWRQQVPPPGDARTDVWQMMEFSKRFKLEEVWGRGSIPGLAAAGFEDGFLPDVLGEARRLGYSPETSLYEVLFDTPASRKVAWPDPVAKGHENHTVEHGGLDWFPEKALFQEYVVFGRGHAHDLADFDTYLRDDIRGLRWPVVDGKETPWRFNEHHDPYAKKGSGFDFYGPAMKSLPRGNLAGVTEPEPTSLAGRAKIFFRPYAAPPESPDEVYDLWLCTGRVLEHWHSGSMTRRVPQLHQAMPTAQIFIHPRDAEARSLARNDLAWIESRRGKIQARVEIGGRDRVPRAWSLFPGSTKESLSTR